MHAGAIQRAFEYFAGRAALGFIIPEWLPTLGNLQYQEAVQQLDSVVYSIIDSRSAKLATAPATGPRQVVSQWSCAMLIEDHQHWRQRWHYAVCRLGFMGPKSFSTGGKSCGQSARMNHLLC